MMLSPGITTQERSATAGSISAVATSLLGSCGWLQKGPVNEATLVTSFQDFVDKFGSYWRKSYIPSSVAAYFANGGNRAYIVRVVPDDAAKATNNTGLDDAATSATFYTRQLTDPVVTLDATHYNIDVAIDGGSATTVDVTGDNGVAGSYALSALASAIDSGLTGASCSVESTLGGGSRLKIVSDTTGSSSSLVFSASSSNGCEKELLGLDLTSSVTVSGSDASDWSLSAKYEGAWYNKSRVRLIGNVDSEVNGGWSKLDLYIQEESAIGAGDWSDKESFEALVFDDDSDDSFAPTVVNNQSGLVVLEEGATFDVPKALKAHSFSDECLGEGDGAETAFSGTLLHLPVEEGSFSLTDGSVTAEDDGEGSLSGTGIASGTINYTTGAWTVTFSTAPSSGELIKADYYQAATASEVTAQLSSGSDGTSAITRSLVTDPSLQATYSGVYALDRIDENLNIIMPDFAGNVTVSNDLISWGETTGKRFIVLDTGSGLTPAQAKKYVQKTGQFNSSYAAIYYPWVKIYDPIANDGRLMTVPPSGWVIGAFARTDANKNVGKAPAGITDGSMQGTVGLEYILTSGEMDILYPARVNCLISSDSTGRAVWGARTLSLDSEWKYVNIRRLFMFIRESVRKSMFWAVFENNGPGLWIRASSLIESFLIPLHEDGYFAGETKEESFFVKVDSENNTQADIDAGNMTVDVFIAPNKPAEFIKLRFQQKTADSQ